MHPVNHDGHTWLIGLTQGYNSVIMDRVGHKLNLLMVASYQYGRCNAYQWAKYVERLAVTNDTLLHGSSKQHFYEGG